MQDKTNVMRILDQKKIKYTPYYYDPNEAIAGVDVAKYLGENPKQVFKTLVTVAKSNNHYVFVIPVEAELDLKKAAKAIGEKNVGGCSPIGMKKFFKTVIDESAKDLNTIFVSAGKVGAQVELAPCDLEKVIKIEYSNLTM